MKQDDDDDDDTERDEADSLYRYFEMKIEN